jgi:hypothetical protein
MENNKKVLLFFIFVAISLLGREMNYFVMNNNEGKMPVRELGHDDQYHFSYINNSEIDYWFLSDIFRLPVFFTSSTLIFSIGDFLIVGGMIISISYFIYLKIENKRFK